MFLDMKPMRFKIVYTPIFFLLFLILPGCKTSSTAKLDFSDGSYEGQINKDGEKHGSGIYRWIDGSIYEGNYLNDLRHGHGRFLWANGESYEGDYLKDERTGKELTLGLMVLFTKVNFCPERDTAREFINRWMELFMRVNGSMTYNMVKVH